MKNNYHDYIVECISKYGDKYDYKDLNPIEFSIWKKYNYFCNTHQIHFQQNANYHINHEGCPICRGLVIDIDSFIIKAKSIHGDKYDYSEFEYIKSNIKGIIKCNICDNKFEQSPNPHLRGVGCPKCKSIKLRMVNLKSIDIFIQEMKKLHNNRYDYSEFKYIGSGIKGIIKCNICDNKFEQTPDNHIQKHGCPYCNKGILNNISDVIIKARLVHGDDKYDYSEFKYINTDTKGIIKCNICDNKFEQDMYHHINRRQGCPYCKSSRGEDRVRLYLKENNIRFEEQKKFDGCENKKRLRFDFCIYLNDEIILIEYDGKQHYEPITKNCRMFDFEYIQKNDSIKNQFCKDQNLKLLRISYLDFDNIEIILGGLING